MHQSTATGRNSSHSDHCMCRVDTLTIATIHYLQVISQAQELVLTTKVSICVEFHLHKVVITLSLKFKVSYTIGFLVKKRFYLYAYQLKVSIFHVQVPGILVNHIKHK